MNLADVLAQVSASASPGAAVALLIHDLADRFSSCDTLEDRDALVNQLHASANVLAGVVYPQVGGSSLTAADGHMGQAVGTLLPEAPAQQSAPAEPPVPGGEAAAIEAVVTAPVLTPTGEVDAVVAPTPVVAGPAPTVEVAPPAAVVEAPPVVAAPAAPADPVVAPVDPAPATAPVVDTPVAAATPTDPAAPAAQPGA